MAEYKDKELIDTPSDPPSGDNSNPATKKMEVHHHALHEGKKNWKSYFREFLMLFLAVFCGFLAEYQLEHVIEHNKEKQFVVTLIEDLKSDTVALKKNIIYRENKVVQIDSLMFLLSHQKIKGYEKDLYYLGRMLVRSQRFQSNDRTIIQLRNSGSLRLIRNEQAADSLISYQKLVDIVMVNQEDERSERNKAYEIASKMFNPFVWDSMVNKNGIDRLLHNPPLRSYDQDIQLDLAAYAHTIKGSTFLIGGRLELLNRKAKSLIVFLRREYHVK